MGMVGNGNGASHSCTSIYAYLPNVAHDAEASNEHTYGYLQSDTDRQAL